MPADVSAGGCSPRLSASDGVEGMRNEMGWSGGPQIPRGRCRRGPGIRQRAMLGRSVVEGLSQYEFTLRRGLAFDRCRASAEDRVPSPSTRRHRSRQEGEARAQESIAIFRAATLCRRGGGGERTGGVCDFSEG